jgi:hypothetical protein
VNEDHPSYAMLEINRVSCSKSQQLFGSSILHNNVIELVIKKGEIDRKYNKDWFLGRNQLINIQMSYSQFTQAIMSMNTSGTPVTLRYFNGEEIEQDTSFKGKKDLFEKEFQNAIDKIFNNSIKSVNLASEYIQQTKPLNKVQKQEMYDLLYKINQDLKENLKFIVKSFKEQMDKTITESHGEIEAFFDMKIKSLGLDALQNKLIEYMEEENGTRIESLD